ncbi:thioesterase II family protein [Nocardia stercoris]|uniref:Thioesterase TesA n=1 Tax=Nocardia stercoris TaxID=2483361 RepID=A0A3M2KRD0_9NOCA|nr:alpha/beta fold hydrolase [Nocardia stercoris]RMI28192.1 thioesterase [Nocardia stercoris]
MNTWLRPFTRYPHAVIRLVCFPHAGGAASAYRSWVPYLPTTVDLVAVQYPGREDRFGEPFPADLSDLADQAAEAVRTLADRPTVLFGHSMGGAVAHEVAKRLAGVRPVAHLVVSGRQPPAHHRAGQVHRADSEGLRAELLRLSAANRPLVDNPALLDVMTPAIRADYRLVETYRAVPSTVLRCPVTVFLGEEDRELTEAEAGDWRTETTGAFAVRRFPGDHFYLVPHRARVVAALLAAVLPQPSTP